MEAGKKEYQVDMAILIMMHMHDGLLDVSSIEYARLIMWSFYLFIYYLFIYLFYSSDL